MYYKKNLKEQDFPRALGLEKSQVKRIDDAIAKAYKEVDTTHGWNVDNINAIVAPYIKSQEEAYYACTTILMQLFAVMMETGARPHPAN